MSGINVNNKGKLTGVELHKGKKAIYIGSGPDVGCVSHIIHLVKADVYILSDFEFKKCEELRVDDTLVITSNKDGFELVKSDKNIQFVLIDQAVKLNLKVIRKNSYVCVWTSDSFSNIEIIKHERMGLKFISSHPGFATLFVKIKNPSKNNLRVAGYFSSLASLISTRLLMPIEMKMRLDVNRFIGSISELVVKKPGFKLSDRERGYLDKFINYLIKSKVSQDIISKLKEALNY